MYWILTAAVIALALWLSFTRQRLDNLRSEAERHDISMAKELAELSSRVKLLDTEFAERKPTPTLEEERLKAEAFEKAFFSGVSNIMNYDYDMARKAAAGNGREEE